MKFDLGSGLARFSGLFQFRGGLAFFVRLLPHRSIALNFQFQPIGKCIDHRDADAVQTAGNFVSVAVKLTSGMQHRQHHFRGGTLFGRVHVHWNAPPVVHHRHRIVFVYRDVHFVGVAGHRFVDRVVHHLPNQVMQSHLAG